jgi:hypothetical protein
MHNIFYHPPTVVALATRTDRMENNGDIPHSRNVGANAATGVAHVDDSPFVPIMLR